jgi:riboflavin kinase/FMN adenylyltransferase
MQVVRGSAAVDRSEGPFAVGIGIFDGVHRGHQTLFRKVLALAEAAGLHSMAYTFDPHPARVLNPAKAPRLIEPLEQRITRLEALGIGTLIVEPFSRDFASISAETFASEVLASRIGAQHVVVGADFTFGRGRAGTVPVLAQWGQELGFGVHPVDIVQVGGLVASSTRVREYVWAGAVRGAALILGRPFAVFGVCVRGAQRGSAMGFGTANVLVSNELRPAVGVYAGRAAGVFGTRDAVINVGFAPTFGEGELKVEVHLLDYDGGQLYGTALSVDFVDRLRDELRFDGVEALKAQIAKDVADARRVLAATPAAGP